MSRGGKSVRWASSLMQAGFTMYPNTVLLRTDLTPHAKTLYGLLIHYAREDEAAYPGQALLHTKVPCSIKGLYNAKRELEAARLLVTIQRGRGRTNQYVLLDPANAETPEDVRLRLRAEAPDAKKGNGQDRHEVPIKNGTRFRSRSEPVADPCVTKKHQKNKHSEEPPKAPLPAQPAGEGGGDLVLFDQTASAGLSTRARARLDRTRRRLQPDAGDAPDPTNGDPV